MPRSLSGYPFAEVHRPGGRSPGHRPTAPVHRSAGAVRSLLPARATANESRTSTQAVVITPAQPADEAPVAWSDLLTEVRPGATAPGHR
jgi:hypothetical protein